MNRILNAIKIRGGNFFNKYIALLRSFFITITANKKTISDIKKYNQDTKIYDIFSLFNELDMLEIRLNILDPYVDYFVIVESNKTFSGLSKPFYYEENKDRFSKWENKIIYSKIVDMPDSMDELNSRLGDENCTGIEKEIIQNTIKSKNIQKGQANWIRDFYQKEYPQKILTGLSDTDICFVSDIDEIWNPQICIDYTKNYIYKLEQKVYTYYLNNRSNEYWIPAFVTKYKNLKHKCLNHIRSDMKANYVILKNAGWHFTNQGGLEKLKEKIVSYSHQEFNTENIKSQIEKHMQENTDFAGRKKFKFWIDESDLPEYVTKNKDKYKELFK